MRVRYRTAMATGLDEALTRVERIRLDARGTTRDVDEVSTEAPLEIRIDAVPIAVVMRTPGADIDLGWGFLRTEGIVTSPEQVRSLRHCDTVDDPRAEDNVLQVRLAEASTVDLARLRRNLYASSSCGICGKASIQAAMHSAPARPSFAPGLSLAAILDLQRALRNRQQVFERTGGLHAAAVATSSGELLCVREDVGRHNAVDKVIGACFAAGTTPADGSLVVSGRVSFEVVQKAHAGGMARVVAVSAPTSLAVEFAREVKLGLIAFVRDGAASVYAGPA